MYIGQLALKGLVAHTAWERRGGDKGVFCVEVIAKSSTATLDIDIEHKKLEEVDSAATDLANTIAVSSVTVGNARNTEFKPLWRWKLVVTGSNTYDWVHFRLLAAQWERN